MPPILIKNGAMIQKDGIRKNSSVLIQGSTIASVGKCRVPEGAVTIDAAGLFVSPGFIDTHIHGQPADILAHELRFGTTAIVPALSCASLAAIKKIARKIRAFRKSDALGSAVIGMRIEGPYINVERAGAQPKRFIQPPSECGLRSIIAVCGAQLKIMTVAPELDGAAALTKILKKHGIIASAGHSDADYREAIEGIDAGMNHATHLFNGMRRMSPLDAGVAGACLTDRRVVAELIADLVHVQPALLKLAVTMKGLDGVILVTDSVRAESKGRRRQGGAYRLPNGTIAGSGLTMMEAVKNIVIECGISLHDAVRFATVNPARLLGVGSAKGTIARGKDADIVIFDKEYDVKMTIVRGRIVYRKKGF